MISLVLKQVTNDMLTMLIEYLLTSIQKLYGDKDWEGG